MLVSGAIARFLYEGSRYVLPGPMLRSSRLWKLVGAFVHGTCPIQRQRWEGEREREREREQKRERETDRQTVSQKREGGREEGGKEGDKQRERKRENVERVSK